jgi:hypothetical protein
VPKYETVKFTFYTIVSVINTHSDVAYLLNNAKNDKLYCALNILVSLIEGLLIIQLVGMEY